MPDKWKAKYLLIFLTQFLLVIFLLLFVYLLSLGASDVGLTLINNFILMFSTKHFSTSSKNKAKKRKTLKSPESKPYEDLYLGRGKPEISPDWNADNEEERSPFGCSWSKKERGINPIKTKLEHYNIDDPFNNRNTIKEICRGKRVVYIWTYIPTGICLVGSSSNSVERIISYFESKTLFLDNRRGVQFLANYGFKDIRLTIIPLDYQEFTSRDVKLLEAFYILELNSSLNTVKTVYIAPEVELSALSFVELTNRDTSVPIFVYGEDLTRVLYVFPSKTALYGEFNVHHITLDKILNKINQDKLEDKYSGYFTFTSALIDGSNLDSLLSLEELISLRDQVDPAISHNAQKIIVIDLLSKDKKKLQFLSITKAFNHIKSVQGTGDRHSIARCLKENRIYKKRWKILESK